MRKSILLSLLIFATAAFAQSNQELNQLRKLTDATLRINALYVDTVDTGKLVENAIEGMLEKLDPHSSYIPKEEVDKMNEPLVGNFEGIGVQFQMIDDTLYVEQTIVGGPSEKVGILPGDRIVVVNDSSIAGVKMSSTDIMKRLRGKKGTMVRVKILRRGIDELIEFRIVRDKIPLYSIDATYLINDSIGYIKLSKFSATTKDEFTKALSSLQAKGITSLVLDLQSNGGGYMNAATALADEFLPNNALIVYTKSRELPGRPSRFDYRASYKGGFKNGKLIILVDEYSASASEILAGAVQDWDKGVIVGRRTYGKGLVQQPIMLTDGSMLRLTMSRYYTPSGRSIQRPYKDGVEKYRNDLVERYNHGELTNADSIHFPDSLRHQTLRFGRTVYGGGGIMPDFFVPLDTTFTSAYLTKMIAKGVVQSFVSKFIEKNEKQLQKDFPVFEKYCADFSLQEEDLTTLTQMAEAEKVPFDSLGFARSKQFLSTQIKALIARRLWGQTEFYQVYNIENEAYRKAIEILIDPKMYDAILR
jgi:carboxyl-terminal processing protease